MANGVYIYIYFFFLIREIKIIYKNFITISDIFLDYAKKNNPEIDVDRIIYG